ncbi:hypothetical protein L6452_21394 [Arctium lappa]|uniref:Uncharacterized protein n=1 Tax=Arctium lappa TaxID=4217 RepID=A0ACB9BFC1_ARCLA|nr:hypothetical protein L6452_21394 [Arctium lappa]
MEHCWSSSSLVFFLLSSFFNFQLSIFFSRSPSPSLSLCVCLLRGGEGLGISPINTSAGKKVERERHKHTDRQKIPSPNLLSPLPYAVIHSISLSFPFNPLNSPPLSPSPGNYLFISPWRFYFHKGIFEVG